MRLEIFRCKVRILFGVTMLGFLFGKPVSAEKVLPEPFGRIYLIYYQGNIGRQLNNDFYFKTIEIGLKGALLDYLTYRAQIKLDNKTFKFQPLDAYFDIQIFHFIRLRIGQFKPPFAMERLIPSPEQDFVATAMATKLLPERDIGIALFGETNKIEFNIGVLNGAGFNKAEDNSKKDLVGRVLFKIIKNIRMGGAVYLGWQGPDTNIIKKQCSNLQAEIKYPKFHARSEYTHIKENKKANTDAFYVQTGYKFTIPNNYLKKLEPVIRCEQLNSKKENGLEKLTVISLGFNFYFYEHKFKCQINYNLKMDKISGQKFNEFYIGLQIAF